MKTASWLTDFKSLLWVTLAVMLTQVTPAPGAGFYIKADGGANLMENPQLDLGGAPGKLKLDTGYRADISAGYQLNGWASIEIGGGFLENSIDSVALETQTARPSDSSFQGVPLLASLVFRYENRTDFIPYAGVGAGGLVSILKIGGSSDTDLEFAYQAMAGLIYKLEDNAWIDIGYKFLGSTDQRYKIGGTPVTAKDVRSHFIGASVTWKF